MKRIVIVYEYDGSEYNGSQSQINGRTVQDDIEAAIFRVTGEKIRITPSGRTDAGVSALNQTAHFDSDCTVPPERVYLALNSFLPETVRIKRSFEASEGFHARFSAVKKTYEYRMYVSEVTSPVRRRTFARVDPGIDAEKMKAAARGLVGTHDFRCFMSSGSKVKDTVRTVYDCGVFSRGDEIYIRITADGFLYNMVRIIAGTLIGIGQGKPYDIEKIIDGGSRQAAGTTAPACGLTLIGVEYPKGDEGK